MGEEPPPLYYPSCDVWLTSWLLPTWTRSTSTTRLWCAHWWMHPEAVARIDAMWRAWEHLRLDPATGMSTWWRDHGDYHLTAITAPDGPFKSCTREHKDRGNVLSTQPPPA